MQAAKYHSMFSIVGYIIYELSYISVDNLADVLSLFLAIIIIHTMCILYAMVTGVPNNYC